MASNGKTKAKILYLLRILQEETDSEHGLTMSQILEQLEKHGIPAERKSIYNDIKTLREFDIDVIKLNTNPVEYAIKRRDFSLGELMLIVDAIQSCHAITDKQARTLTTNVKLLASTREKDLLDRHIHVTGRITTKSDSVFSTVDAIHEALRLKCKLEFSYRKRNVDGTFRETRGGRKHEVTPVEISYDDGFYYLSAWNEAHGNMSEYRLDRMAKVRVLSECPATHNEETAHHRYDDPGSDAVMFGRFSQEEVTATLSASEDKVEILTDRFGDKGTFLAPDLSDSESGPRARMCVKVCKSEQFFGWVAGMGKAVRIEAPERLVREYKDYLRYLLED